MPLYERVEGSWEDLVRVDELSELWRSRWDVALIDSSDSDDSDDGSLPELLDGSDRDERDQDFDDRQLGPDASGLSEGHCSVWWDSFRVGFESARAFEAPGGVQDLSESGGLWIVSGCTPTDRLRDLQRVVRTFLACTSLLGAECFRSISMSQVQIVLVGA
jgi:hypothetical protein